MSFASVMVHLDIDEATPENRIRLAADLAHQFNATLIGITACMPILPRGVEPAVELHEAELERQKLSAEIAAKERLFIRLTKDTAGPKEWRSALDLPDKAVPREARAADLVIISKDQISDDPIRSLDPNAAILTMGCPVLAVPRTVSSLKPKRVLIAWQDARESRRAIKDALPFLHNADEVLVTQVCQLSPTDEAKKAVNDVVQYFLRHRIMASAGIMLRSSGTVAEELIRVAQYERIDLIVAGAYGHSRLGEWAFGGVTRELLASSPVCCLFSH